MIGLSSSTASCSLGIDLVALPADFYQKICISLKLKALSHKTLSGCVLLFRSLYLPLAISFQKQALSISFLSLW